MSSISTHVLDTSIGRPGKGIKVTLLSGYQPDLSHQVGGGTTDDDGRVKSLFHEGHSLKEGVYKLVFATGAYFEEQGKTGFYPEVEITFEIKDASQHYHVPLLLNPFGYSTYRGS